MLAWYAINKRTLPWRELSGNAYAVWISEIMLQQTTVQTVIPYFQKFMERFPCIYTLSKASLDEVFHIWQGLGYYRRAAHLHQAACILVEKGGHFPTSYEGWLALPGIGTYTASAICAIALALPYAAVDGNIYRIFARYAGLTGPGWKRQATSLAEMALPSTAFGDYTQSLMDLGAEICTPRQPSCVQCPVQKGCFAFQFNQQDVLPDKIKKEKKYRKGFVRLLLSPCHSYIQVKKGANAALLKGLWGFPTNEWSVCSETTRWHWQDLLISQADSTIGQGPVLTDDLNTYAYLGHVAHIFTHFHLTLHIFFKTIYLKPHKKFDTNQSAVDEQWYRLSALDQLAFSTLMRKVHGFFQAHLTKISEE